MIGLRVLQRRRAVDAALAKRFLGVPVANVSDCMSRMFGAGSRLRPMHDGSPMAGAALTVRTSPGDNLLVHKAISMAEPGDVIVVDGGGDLTNALIGELMAGAAVARGVAGMVIHGAVRDAAALRLAGFPVFAGGVTHRGPYRDGPGEINVPLALDGMVVEPGDLIIGDADGVLCLPFSEVASLLEAAVQRGEMERKIMANIELGQYNTDWVDVALERLGCEVPS